MRTALVLYTAVALMVSGCYGDTNQHIQNMPKIDAALCTQIVEQPTRKVKIHTPKYPSRTAPNFFKNTSALEQLGFNQRTGNILFLNCIKFKYQEVIQKEIEPDIEKYGQKVNYPKNTTAQACDGAFVNSITEPNNSGSHPYLLMEALCHKHNIQQGIQEINKMIVRGGDLLQQGCSIFDLYRSDQPGQNLYCLNRINNLAEKGFPAFGHLQKWDPDNNKPKKK